MNFDIETTYKYLNFVDNYTYKHYCSKNKCETCPYPDVCIFLFNFLNILERIIDKEKLL